MWLLARLNLLQNLNIIDILASLTKGKPLGFNYLKSSENNDF